MSYWWIQDLNTSFKFPSRDDPDQHIEKEIRVTSGLGNLCHVHPHLISFLSAFKQNGECSLIFPWGHRSSLLW